MLLVLPFSALSLAALLPAAAGIRQQQIAFQLPEQPSHGSPRRLLLLGALFVLCLLAVLHIVHYLLVTAIVVAIMLLTSRDALRRVDYSLLATFVCFFIFAGNMGEIPFVRQVLEKMVARAPMGISVGLSQMISNVPTAVLLSGFTQDGTALLVGTNLGGLGTPVASLASLISLRLYGKTERADNKAYFQWFFAANGIGLAVLLLTAWVLKQL